MGFLGGIFKRSDKSDDHDDDRKKQRNNKEKLPSDKSNDSKSPKSPKRKRPSLRRRVSTNSMRRIREVGLCLRLIGDDVERQSISGSQQNVNNNTNKTQQNKDDIKKPHK